MDGDYSKRNDDIERTRAGRGVMPSNLMPSRRTPGICEYQGTLLVADTDSDSAGGCFS